MSTGLSLHAPGYEGEAEEIVTVREIHRAECEQCGWVSEEFDEMGWKDAEQAAVEHFEECPEIWDNTEECDCPEGPTPRESGGFITGDFCSVCRKALPADFDEEEHDG